MQKRSAGGKRGDLQEILIALFCCSLGVITPKTATDFGEEVTLEGSALFAGIEKLTHSVERLSLQ